MLHSNAVVFERLVQLVRDHSLIAFVGAGVSKGAKYPTWSELLDLLHEELPKIPAFTSAIEDSAEQTLSPKYVERLRHIDDLPWRAEKYRQLLGRDKFLKVINSAFAPRPSQTPLIDGLAKLAGKGCFRHILTTNYDTSLEEACNSPVSPNFRVITWSERDKVSEFLAGLGHSQQRYYVYLHGRYDSKLEDIVLSEGDYIRRYVVSDDANKKLFALFLTQPVLFVGFSLTDPDLASLMRVVNAYLGATDQDKSLLLTRRFAILPLREERDDLRLTFERYQEKLGIAPIFYPYTDDHRGLLDTIEALNAALETQGIGAAIERLPLTPDIALISDDPVSEEFGMQPEKDGVRLSGSVNRTEHPDWFFFSARVESIDAERPLAGQVEFVLHPTFSPPRVQVSVTNGVARFEGHAYGAFTIGALVGNQTKLGLDLASVPGAPEEFRSR